MIVDFDAAHGRILFFRIPAAAQGEDLPPDDWRRRLYAQAKPKQIQLLQLYGSEVASSSGAAATKPPTGPCEPDSGSSTANTTPAQPNTAEHAAIAESRTSETEPDGTNEVTSEDAPTSAVPAASPLDEVAPKGEANHTATVEETGSPCGPSPRCVCGSMLRRTNVQERVFTQVSEEALVPPPPTLIEQLMMHPPIICDICSRQVAWKSRIWTCENGTKTVLHASRYDICESCFSLHAFGVELPDNSEDQYEPDDNEYYGADDSSTEDEGGERWSSCWPQ